MNILWLNWKDKSHPRFGGAEVVNEELAKRLVRDGHSVTFIVAGFFGAKPAEERDGFRIMRVGGRCSVYWHAYRLYKKEFRGWPDVVIDEMNTIPFFARFYAREKTIMFVHQLCREIWFYQISFPFNIIGYLLEPLYLRLLSGSEVVTISESTKKDLMRFGFNKNKIHIISEGVDIEPVSELPPKDMKNPIILTLGRCDPMKRTVDVVKAFESVKEKIPAARLVIAGLCDGSYGTKVRRMREVSRYKGSITITGPISHGQKVSLLGEAAVLVSTSVKEGWGLVVTEANSQGTPAVVYNADGLRDSVRDNETGLVCSENTPENLVLKIKEVLGDEALYGRLQKNAWEWSKEINFDTSYQQFVDILKNV